MTDTLRHALREDAGTVKVPTLDAKDVIAQGEQRLRRRRITAGLAAVVAVAAICVGTVLVTRGDPSTQGPLPVAPPSSPKLSEGVGDRHGARPLVYADGSTVHVGDKTVETRDPVAFIDATDDGVVYEAALDGMLWFTDGTTTSMIGTSACVACPTAHAGVVTTGDSGSLVVWADVTGRKNNDPVDFIVYDTSRRKEVARVPITEPDRDVVYIDEDQVWFTSKKSTHLVRFDVATGEITNTGPAELDAELSMRSRMFVVEVNDPDTMEPGFSDDVSFRQIGRRLADVTTGGEPQTLTRTNCDEVRLQLPSGFTALGMHIDSSVVSLSQWLDDDRIVVFANGGGGDLSAQEGDLLVCPLPDGICRIAVPRSSSPYVAP
jgi:hypothetical protein